ncbi:uncharacterized protein LOC127841071 isoform X2 [Dreissena polymorpha]|uniref:uncharacterized protein LOC127841071 isoform X2 n=1 Tax=Dreissena polymorpha TaxID=45954 RepID=UPI002265250F|nr:uncharacterized protein LOC127841071 isoform X2 [Dreissena polymorpha]
MALDTRWDESEVKEIASHLHDGRLVELSTSFLMQLKKCSDLTDKGGGFGKIYVSRESIPGFKQRLVLKEIGGDQGNNKSQSQLLSSVKNEKLASRVRHFAIVPLLAYHDDISIGKYYLISPYFENKDLFDAIQSDNGDTILLNWITRLKVIYQIACAIDYMHTPNSFRGTILHLDIKSKNIVLDKKYNARLIDFGLSRESMAGGKITTAHFSGTELYRPIGCYKPSPLLDYYAFGVVIRELLTGLCPDGTGPEAADAPQTPLGRLDMLNFEVYIQKRIWNVDVWENLSKIADRCISGCNDKDKQITSESMRSSLKSIVTREGTQEWTVLGDDKCEICVVNKQLEQEDSFVGQVTGKYHASSCTTRIKTCCACMRNGYINPVKCQGCENEIKAIIGNGWGAILIAGYDEDNSFFQKDVKVFAHAISSKVLPSMCVSTLIVIDPASNKAWPVSARIHDAFETMAKRDIHTFVFLYSGHHGKTGFQVGMNEYFSIQQLNDSIQKCTNIEKVIAFMDCCQPEEIKVNKDQRLIQFNATSSATDVIWKQGQHSYFTKVLVQAFTMKASGGKCECLGCECFIDGNFITIDKLKNYIEIHRKNGLLPHDPHWCVSKIDWCNEYLAYNYSYKVAFHFEIILPIPFTAKQTHEVLATTVVDYQDLIQTILFPRFANLLREQLNTHGKSISRTDTDADVLCIVYETGPTSCEEVDNIETLLLAWNSKRVLSCKLRFSQTSNFDQPFGFFLENGTSVKDNIYEKNEFELKEMENILHELQDKNKKCNIPEKALTDFILNVSSFINWCNQTKLKHRKLKIRFIDLFEECSSCVVHLLLIAQDTHDSSPSIKMIENSFKNSDSNYRPSMVGIHGFPSSYDAMITKTMKDELHDGRLTELPNEMVEELKTRSTTLAGQFGKVYISKDRVPGFNGRVVLKEIDLTAGEYEYAPSITNAKLAGRLKHFGIVPLLAYYDDNVQGKYYLLTPYLENGTLFQAIADDDVRLEWHIRVKIMYQIACAIDFMHTGNKFRRTVLHMNIKSKNIVLDTLFNARLINFGLAREFKEDDATSIITTASGGTPGHYGQYHIMLTKNHDYHNYGVVLLELITGLHACTTVDGHQLRQWPTSLVLSKQDSVWNKNTDVYKLPNKLATIAAKCVESVTTETSIKLEQIRNYLKDICRKWTVSKWDYIEGSRCEICLINDAIEVGFDGHGFGSNCLRHIRICCSCMRNSYINPIECHTCGETIEPFINASWGAILVAGYHEIDGDVFKKDIRHLKEVITSKLVPVMCINTENVIIPKIDMEYTTPDRHLDEAFERLSERNIQTLLFAYSGHYTDGGFKVGPNVNYPFIRICDKLNTWNADKPDFRKVIAFLDCSYPTRMALNNSFKLIQFNAASQTQQAIYSRHGSLFLQDVIQAFTIRAIGKECEHDGCKCKERIQGDFITYDDLWRYLNEHEKQGYYRGVRPCIHTSNIEQEDSILAYNCDLKVNVAITVEWDEIPSKTIHVALREFNEFVDVKLILASNVLKHVYGIDAVGRDIMSKFAEDISVEIKTGPNTDEVQEIDNLEMLLHAWNSKRQLICTARLLHNLDVGKPVGRCLKDVPGIRDVHQAVLQKCDITARAGKTNSNYKPIHAVETCCGHNRTYTQTGHSSVHFFL